MHVDRTKLTIAALHDDAFDITFRAQRSPRERMPAVELHRQVAYGRANMTATLARRVARVQQAARHDYPSSH
jgi:hypothetical protein